jgi:hypothetical protein
MTSSSSTSSTRFLPLLSKASVSNPMFVKSISVLADFIAYLYFLAMTIILRDYEIDHATKSNSSLISLIIMC